MSKIDQLNKLVWYRMLYNCTHMATVIKWLKLQMLEGQRRRSFYHDRDHIITIVSE